MFLALAALQGLGDTPCTDPDYRHGISYVEPLRYGAEFRHFDYANPDAPKGGRIRLPQMGTFDNFNAIVEAGRMAAGYGAMGSLVYDTMLEDTIDEPASAYVRLADGVAVEQDYRWVAFRLHDGARWHDGRPITTEDVVFTFEAIREHGSVALRTALADLDRIETFGTRELCFVTRPEAEPNPILPFQYGRIAILPKHYWQDPAAGRDITKTTTVAPPGSGPYRLAHSDFGRTLTYERVPDYWGRDLSVTRGRYNFDVVKFDYFRDENVQLEAHKADVVDVREESISKNWATQYDFPAVQSGLFRAELRYVTRVWGPLVAHLLELGPPALSRHPRARGALAPARLQLHQPLVFLQLLRPRRQLLPELGDGARGPAFGEGTCAPRTVARPIATAGIHGAVPTAGG